MWCTFPSHSLSVGIPVDIYILSLAPLGQAFSLADGTMKSEVAVNVTKCLLGIAHCVGGFPYNELFGIGVVVGQGNAPSFVCHTRATIARTSPVRLPTTH